MTRACPILTPEQERCADIQFGAEDALLAKVRAALDEAHATAAAQLRAIGEERCPSRDYFTSVVHQALYCELCGADPHTFVGGDPKMALALIRNAKNVARHHWGADIPPDPEPARPAAAPPG